MNLNSLLVKRQDDNPSPGANSPTVANTFAYSPCLQEVSLRPEVTPVRGSAPGTETGGINSP